jgi:hypothetical protein
LLVKNKVGPWLSFYTHKRGGRFLQTRLLQNSISVLMALVPHAPSGRVVSITAVSITGKTHNSKLCKPAN